MNVNSCLPVRHSCLVNHRFYMDFLSDLKVNQSESSAKRNARVVMLMTI